MFSKVFALTGLVSVASAHILLTNPVPYGGINNSPLFADGSDFPCKAVSYNANGISNTYEQGSTQQLAFKGTAVHGGGSCQVSVTTDLNPTRDSVWKVIKSIEGGCPARDQAGNIGNDAEAEVPYKYDFTIPSDLAAGQYVLAWTWFNKIGNREMYMNCAPVTVTGSASDTSFYNALPDMFVANVGNGCSTTESTDLQFPNPGSLVDQFNGATTVFAGPVGSCPTGTTGSNPDPVSPAPVEPTVTEAPVVENPVVEDPVVEDPVVEDPVVEDPVVEDPVDDAPVVENPVETPVTTPVTGGQAAGTACSPEGDWNCVDGTSFQRCASGVWSALQALSAGTSCTPGQGSSITMARRSGGFSRRAMRIRG